MIKNVYHSMVRKARGNKKGPQSLSYEDLKDPAGMVEKFYSGYLLRTFYSR